jgi:flagellar motor switch protein FliG
MAADLTPQGIYKGAVVLAALGADAAARVLGHLDDFQVEALIREMSRLGPIQAGERDRVVEEFTYRLEHDSGSVGGRAYAHQLLEQALGPERALRMLSDGSAETAEGPSLASILESTSPESLAALVADEHPQLIALLMGQLSVEQAAVLLSALPAEVRSSVAVRLAEMEAPAPIALQHLERCLVGKLRGEQQVPAVDQPGAGPRRVADILGRMRRSVESMVLASLEQQAPAVAEKINQCRFTFDDAVQLDGRSLQRILRDVDFETLRLAMRGLDEERQQQIFSNMSERASTRLREELETSGPARLREVEAAQQAIVAVARALQEEGEIQFAIGESAEGGEDTFV